MLNLLKEANTTRQKEIQSYLSINEGWYKREEFRVFLMREKNRSDRNGLPLSYVVIDLSSTVQANREENLISFTKKLIDVISENTRNYDVKTFLTVNRIGILLVDTSLDQAKDFIEKISKNIFDHFYRESEPFYLNMIKNISISSYPMIQVEESGEIKGVPVILKSMKYKNNDTSMMSRIDIINNHRIKINWNSMQPGNGSTAIALPMSSNLLESIQQFEFSYDFLKRIIDIIGSICAIILLSPAMVFIAIVIKFTSQGPVLFKQKRVGFRGKPFTFLKFRSMRTDTDDRIHQEYVRKLIEGKNDEINLGTKERPLYKITKDPRITRVGNFLRKTSLDELPQLFNVLEGSMSLVGPRPPIPYEVEVYQNWHFRRILEVKPGITGLWQVYGRSSTTFDEMVRLDLQYVRKRSIPLDIKILLQTFNAVFNTKGAM